MTTDSSVRNGGKKVKNGPTISHKFERVKFFLLIIKYMQSWSSYIGERPLTNNNKSNEG